MGKRGACWPWKKRQSITIKVNISEVLTIRVCLEKKTRQLKHSGVVWQEKSNFFFKQNLDLEIDPFQTFSQVLNKTIIGGFCQKMLRQMVLPISIIGDVWTYIWIQQMKKTVNLRPDMALLQNEFGIQTYQIKVSTKNVKEVTNIFQLYFKSLIISHFFFQIS